MRTMSWTLLLLAVLACTAAEDIGDTDVNNADAMEDASSGKLSLLERLTEMVDDIDEMSEKYRRGYKGYHPSFRGVLRGTKYLVFKYERNYDTAKEVCHGFGGILADLKTEAVHNFVEGLVRKADPKKSYWIGLNDMATEDAFVWSDGTPVNTCGYTNWAPGQPDNFFWSQDCGRLWDFANFKWDDENCASKHHFVCQIGPGPRCGGMDG
ncbi:C-type lectin lectoxin-Lio2-like [Branchiostoma floridae]|uniref:C-type lectin lectoxin-Lio2-like n=1 Tax=Branchiostoma floridae TaxID=7739 RepID=A0A9J7L7L2_BRAFL|nr:C-type lectin lectoxin-Lio2-like [Branchiostoma floridae]XP_035677684.1 C-type lectin lectoxin-Lio2-like [Branchiostoma floridae]